MDNISIPLPLGMDLILRVDIIMVNHVTGGSGVFTH